jgi:hypothetical protein
MRGLVELLFAHQLQGLADELLGQVGTFGCAVDVHAAEPAQHVDVAQQRGLREPEAQARVVQRGLVLGQREQRLLRFAQRARLGALDPAHARRPARVQVADLGPLVEVLHAGHHQLLHREIELDPRLGR